MAMAEVEGAKNFTAGGSAYDNFIGRYSKLLAVPFADAAGVSAGQTAIDVGCGPGALTAELVKRLGEPAVRATDPSASFAASFAERFPGVEFKAGQAEAIPFEDASADHAMAQLVFHFVSDPLQAARDMARVTKPGGVVSACVWDFDEGMEMLRAFWDAALSVHPDAPDESLLKFGRAGEIAELFAAVGLRDIEESTLSVPSTYANFDELWAGFTAGIGPAGGYLVTLDADAQEAVRAALFERIGSPSGSFTMDALARCAIGRV